MWIWSVWWMMRWWSGVWNLTTSWSIFFWRWWWCWWSKISFDQSWTSIDAWSHRRMTSRWLIPHSAEKMIKFCPIYLQFLYGFRTIFVLFCTVFWIPYILYNQSILNPFTVQKIISYSYINIKIIIPYCVINTNDNTVINMLSISISWSSSRTVLFEFKGRKN